MKKYHLVNNLIGWVIGIIACSVYLLTAEPTASWWDCGEYIATADKIQVGHPPGAPTFQVIGRLFTMFVDKQHSAFAINAMSAISSGLSIMFLFWTITLFGKKIAGLRRQDFDIKDSRVWAVFASGIVGSLAYCFSDTFWFSAVEGEVYAMSSFFTAVVFWAVLKWEEQADQPHALRWLILISFLIGAAIGVHLLNLLAIPAIVYVYYFKRWEKTTLKGFIFSGIISVVLLALILFLIIPYIVNWAGAIEVFFVNSLGLPFNVGTIFYFAVLVGLIVWGILYTYKRNKPVWNSVILSLLFLLIGYSTFFILVIRSNANTPINENAPKDAVALRAYLGREQYGSSPLFYGQYFTAGDPIGTKEGYIKYVKGQDENGKDRYVEATRTLEYEYSSEDCGVFPRMHSNENARKQQYYKYWSGTPGTRKPTFGENLKFFFSYQVHFMYWRYFMWNFVGRQNDIQGNYFNDDGTRDYINGNWISGIKFLDEIRLGPQSDIPDHLKNNKARNTYYFLPLLLGLCGVLFHYRKNKKDFFVVFLLFFMTGIAIVVYLNQKPIEPRERDYAYAASFYAFAIWIGLGVMALAEWLQKLNINHRISTVAVFVATMLLVPGIMAKENWDDHDRSKKYAARDFADNYLNVVRKNGIIITYGDNDTFPLWYTQEVEGTRTDVRILNYTLAGMYWYVEQLYNTLYESENLPFTLPKEYYGLGRDVTCLMPRTSEYIEVTDLFNAVKSHPEQFVQYTTKGDKTLVLPTKRFKITLDKEKLVKNGIITQACADTIPDVIRWEIKKDVLYRHELMILDIFGTNKFEREICLLSLDYKLKDIVPFISEYNEQVGMVYRMLPYSKHSSRAISLEETYNYYIDGEKSGTMKWGNLNNPDVYVDPVSFNMGVVQRQTWALLAQSFIDKGALLINYKHNGRDSIVQQIRDQSQLDKAKEILALAEKYFPKENFPRDRYTIFFVEVYSQVGDTAMAKQYLDDICEYYTQDLKYYAKFKGKKAQGVRHEMEIAIQILVAMQDLCINRLNDKQKAEEIEAIVRPYLSMYAY